jgi:hypothetical protein
LSFLLLVDVDTAPIKPLLEGRQEPPNGRHADEIGYAPDIA